MCVLANAGKASFQEQLVALQAEPGRKQTTTPVTPHREVKPHGSTAHPHPILHCGQAALGSGCTCVWQLLASHNSSQTGPGRETWHPAVSLPNAKSRASQANKEGSAGSTREA